MQLSCHYNELVCWFCHSQANCQYFPGSINRDFRFCKHMVKSNLNFMKKLQQSRVDNSRSRICSMTLTFSAAAFAEAPWCILPPKALPPHPSRALLTRQPLVWSEIANIPCFYVSVWLCEMWRLGILMCTWCRFLCACPGRLFCSCLWCLRLRRRWRLDCEDEDWWWW